MRSRGGLTLVEMLVAIAIIVLLAALLLPVLGHVREQARRTKCANHLGQIGKAQGAYTGGGSAWWTFQQDERTTSDMLADTSHPVNSLGDGRSKEAPWQNSCVSLSLLYPRWIDTDKVFGCPSTSDRPMILSWEGARRARYSWFGRMNGERYVEDGPYAPSDRPNSVTPDNTSYGYDDRGDHERMAAGAARAADMQWHTPEGVTLSNHDDDGWNVLYWDGHVAFADTVYASSDPRDNIFRYDGKGSAKGLKLTPTADACIVRTHEDGR